MCLIPFCCNPTGHHVDDILETHVNPRFMANFGEEDFLGKLVRLGRLCHGSTCTKRMLQRYILYIVFRMKAASHHKMLL